MDIRKKRVAPTAPLHLKDAAGQLMYAEGADGKPDKTRPCRVWLHGPGSARFVATKESVEHEAFELARTNKGDISAEQGVLTVKRRATFLTAVTDRWENIEATDDAGNPLTGDDLSMAIYGDVELGYITDQCDKFTVGWANFIVKSVKN